MSYIKILPDFIEMQRISFCWFISEGLNDELTNFYKGSMGQENKIDTITLNAKVGKSLIPAWAYKSWKEKYKIKYLS